MSKIKELVEALPEVYQNIYGHSEFDEDSSRNCELRKKYILRIISAYQKYTNKKELKVLDLGCAQGYYSFSVAEIGCKVDAVDYLDKNIDLCKALREENQLDCTFKEDKISMEMIDSIEDDSYDIIMFFSVVHHISNEHGFLYARELFEKLFTKAPIVLTELAVKEEPVFWNVNLPEKYEDWFENVRFYDEQDFFGTHLSEFKRPLLFSSNKYCYVDGEYYEIEEYKTSAYKGKVEDLGRRYYICNNQSVFIKRFSRFVLGQLKEELKNEIDFLKANSDFEFTPDLLYSSVQNERIISATKIKYGMILYEYADNYNEIDLKKVFSDVLNNCVELEKRGYYHTDIRPWNICIDNNKRAFLIDFGAIATTKDDVVLQGQYDNLSNKLTVFDSFVALIYDCLTAKRYDSIEVLGTYHPSMYYELDIISSEYATFIRKYLSTPRDKMSFDMLKDMFERFVTNHENYSFTSEEKIAILERQLRALRLEKLDSLYFKMEYYPWKKNVDTYVLQENKDREVSKNAFNELFNAIEALKLENTNLRNELESINKWAVLKGYKKIRNLFK